MIKKVLKKVWFKIFHEEKQTVNAYVYDKNNLLSGFFNTLKKASFTPQHIVDVGANRGTWTREALKHYPDAFYTLLEPQIWLRESLLDILEEHPKVNFYGLGAGSNKGSFWFTIVERDDSCTFSISETEALERGLKQVKIPVVALNEFLPTVSEKTPDLIKIDAEGLDLDVLQGANQYFGITELFMIEVGVVNKEFDNSCLKVMTIMNQNGYRLFEITDLNRPFASGVLWLMELVFVKKGGIIDSYKYS